MSSFYPKIGLEVHFQLATKTKMFCSCPNDPEAPPNTTICEICTGHPGTLPVPNKKAIEYVIKVGLALNCKISNLVVFDRKNYFYPDLPKGYQISQHFIPLATEGHLILDNGKKIKIKEIHLEEDTGRLIHQKDYTLVDFNRAGVPLVELVTYPDFEEAREVVEFGKKLQTLLRYLKISSADMEKGNLRLEANVSVSTQKNTLGTKVELKNINSFKALERAIVYEIKRQERVLQEGGKVKQETRGWNESAQKTVPQREKEEVQDYRYFPEPDILPIELQPELISDLQKSLPELPWEKKERYISKLGISSKVAEILTVDAKRALFFEEALSYTSYPTRLADLIVNDLLGELELEQVSLEEVNPAHIAELVNLLEEGKISSRLLKELLKRILREAVSPQEIIEKEGLRLQEKEEDIKNTLQEVISENPQAVADYKKGKEGALHFLLGKAMQKTRGTLPPQKTLELLKSLLEEQK